MSNRNFNKQVTESRKPAFAGGSITKVLRKLGKEIKKNPLPKKTKDLSKKFTETFKDRKVKGE
jgi:hypothetical protein